MPLWGVRISFKNNVLRRIDDQELPFQPPESVIRAGTPGHEYEHHTEPDALTMVATLAQMASAEYYLESQRSYRHPNEYYTAGEEPDGTWFNPHGLFGLADGSRIDSKDFHRLYNGFAPDGSGKLNQNAGKDTRSPGLDMTFSVDKSVSALWAIAEPEMRVAIERLAVDAAQAALQDTVFEHCSYTRIKKGGSDVGTPVPADLMAAAFPHGTSRENDPQLHVHCTILNVARTHQDGKYRAHHQYPAYSWSKAAGALFRVYLTWDLQQYLGVKMEQYGQNGAYTRIPGMPEDLLSFWSKRRKGIITKAGELGIPVRGNASRLAGVNKLTRSGKSHDNDPEVRHRRWRGEVESFAERESLIASVTGNGVEILQQEIRKLTEELDALPGYLAREEAVFKRPDMVEAAANRAAGLLGREAVMTAIERVRRNPEIEALEFPKATAESNAGMTHTERYSTRHNLSQEQAVKDMVVNMVADTSPGLPRPSVQAKIETLQEQGYPLSKEQIAAIRFATARNGLVAVIEGAAGSGKTTTLRPITDLHREHGYEIVPTAVAWRTAVALGNDCEARPVCVDKLLKLAARGQMEIGKNTLIVVDEAGMLSTRQAHHILQLSERHGAKIVFAGDTRQQQPVEAGPGLRLIRDVAGSIRVDRIRRQKADLEDILVYALGLTREWAWHRAVTMERQERDRILTYHGPKLDDAPITPWQGLASEALRDGDAAAAIEAWRKRGRFHICHDEEKTLTRLVEDWAQGVREEPGKSSVVLACTRAETRALSHLMRERHLAGNADTERVVVEVSRNAEDGRIVEPLEIAVGDRLRIGATQWEKQLFNGTIVTVEDFKVLRGGAETDPEGTGLEPAAPSVQISARTDDGREVVFRHDDIRDYHGNIRLDYGYALTITSAQGLTVDRAYLLADDRPARETIYPAATRHRERLDIFVNRAPLALTIAERRTEDQAERPVMDSDIRAHLAERWSRSQPKEAALDYISDGEWRVQREVAGRREGSSRADESLKAAANDNALVRIAGEIRRTACRWRHGQAVAAFADGRREVLAAYDDLRERTRAVGDAVALGGAFRETLARHGMLLKQAEAFRARPADFSSLLAERGSIGAKELDVFEELHDRASRHRRAAVMRHVHRIKGGAEAAQTQRPEPRLDVTAAPTQQSEPERRVNTAPTPAHAGPSAGTDTAPARPDVRALHEALLRDWNRLGERADQAGVSVFDMEGCDRLISRMRSLTENPDLPAGMRQSLAGVLENHQQHFAAGKHVEDWLSAGTEQMRRHEMLGREADGMDRWITGDGSYPEWRRETDRLIEAGEAILSDAKTYGDNPAIGHAPVEQELSRLQRAIHDDDNYAAERKAREQQSERVDSQDKAAKPAGMDTAPAQLDVRTLYEALERDWNRLDERADQAGVSTFDMEGSEPLIARMRSLTQNPDLPDRTRQELAGMLEKYQRHVAAQKRDTVASPAPDESAAATGDPKPQATEKAVVPSPAEPPSVPAPPAWLPAYEALAREWNALCEGARQSGTLSFYSRGYADLIPRIRVLAENPDIPTESRAPMVQALENHERHVSTRKKVEDWLIAVERHMDRRDVLEDAADNLDMPVAKAPDYADWTGEAERLMEAGEAILSDTETYGAHLADITRGELRMNWMLSRLRDPIRKDAEALPERNARERRSERAGHRSETGDHTRQWAGPTFDSDTGGLDPSGGAGANAHPDISSADDTRVGGVLSRLRRAFGWDGSKADRQMEAALPAGMQTALNRWQELKQAWNREVQQAQRDGVHVICTRGYGHMRLRLESMYEDIYLGVQLGPAIRDVLAQLDKAKATRGHIEKYRDSIVEQLALRRDVLKADAAEQGVTVPDHEDYGVWRAYIDELTVMGERILADREAYGSQLAGIALRGEGLGSALSRARETLRDDDRHIPDARKLERQAGRAALREKDNAHSLDEPEPLRKLRQKAEKQEHKASKQQSKGRGMSM